MQKQLLFWFIGGIFSILSVPDVAFGGVAGSENGFQTETQTVAISSWYYIFPVSIAADILCVVQHELDHTEEIFPLKDRSVCLTDFVKHYHDEALDRSTGYAGLG